MTTTTSISVSMSSDNDGQTAPSLPVAIGGSMISRGSELVGSSETISKTEDANHKAQSNPVTETQTVVGTELDDSSLTLMSPFGCGGKHSNMQIQENSCLLSNSSSVSSSEMFGSDKIPSNNVNLDIVCDVFADCSVQSQDMFGSGYKMTQPTDSSIAFSVKSDISSSSESFGDRAQSPPDKNTDVDVKHAEVCNTRPSNPANIGAPSRAKQASVPVYPPIGWLPPGAYYHPVQYHAQSGFPEWNSPGGAPFNANQFYSITPQHMAQYPAQVPTEYFYTYPVPVDPHRQSYPATSGSSQYMTKAGRVDRPPVPLPRDIRPQTQEPILPPSQPADPRVLRMSVKSPKRSADGKTTNTTMRNSQTSDSPYSDKKGINMLAAPRVKATIEEDEMTRSALNMDRLGYLKVADSTFVATGEVSVSEHNDGLDKTDDSHTPDKGEESSVGQLDRPTVVAGSGDTDTRALSETCIDTNKVQDSWVKHVRLRKIGPQWVLFSCGMPVKIPPKLATVNSTKLVVDCTGKLFIANENDVYEVKKTLNRIIFNNLDCYEGNKSDTGDIDSDHRSLQFNSKKQLNKDSAVELELAGEEHELEPHFSTDSVTSVKDELLSDNKHDTQIPAQISKEETSNYVNMQIISESSMHLQQDETISIYKHTDPSSTATMSADTGLNQNTYVVGETMSDKRPEFGLANEKIAISGIDKPEVLEGQKTEVNKVNKNEIVESKLKNGIEDTFKDHKNGIEKEYVKKEESFPGLNINTEATSHAGENVCGYEAAEDSLTVTETGDVTQDAVADNAVTYPKAQVFVVVKCERRLPDVSDISICEMTLIRDLDMDSYMKWQFVVNSPSLRYAAAANIKASWGFQLSVSPDGVCTVMIGKVEETADPTEIVNLVAENIFNVASFIESIAFPSTGMNAEDIVNNIMKSGLGIRHEVYAEVDKDPHTSLVSLAYDTRYSTKRNIGNVIKIATKQTKQQKVDSLKTAADAVHRNVMDKEVLIENPVIYETIFSEEELKSEFPHMASDMTCTKDKCVINMEGRKHDVDSAEDYIEKRKSEFTMNVLSITDIKHFDPSKHSFTKMREIFDSAYKEITMNNCFWSVDDSDKKVYILAAQQLDADKLTNCFKNSLASIKIGNQNKPSAFIACCIEAQISGNLLESNVVGNTIHIVGKRDIVLKLKSTLGKAVEGTEKQEALSSSFTTQGAAVSKTRQSVSCHTGGPLVASTGQGQQKSKVTEVPIDEDALMYLVKTGKLEMIRKRFSVVVKPKEDGNVLEISGAADPVRNAINAIDALADIVISVIINYSATDEEFFKSTDGSAILHTLERDCIVITEVMNLPGQDASGYFAGLVKNIEMKDEPEGVPPPPLTAGSKVKVSTGVVAVKVIGLKGNVEEAYRELTRQLDSRKLTETARAPFVCVIKAPPLEQATPQITVTSAPPDLTKPRGAEGGGVPPPPLTAGSKVNVTTGKVAVNVIGLDQVFTNFRTTMNPSIVAAAKQKGILGDLVEELKVIDVCVDVDGDKTELVMKTVLQLQKSMQIIEEFAANNLQLKRQTIISDCVDIDSVTCSSIAWGVCQIVKKSLLVKIKKENISVSYIYGKILIDRTGPESIPDNVRVLVTELKEFLSNEFEEIPIDGYGQDADRWCSEIEKFVGSECCIYVPEKHAVMAYGGQYARIQLIKHKLNIKQGKVKHTARGRRQRALVASYDLPRALPNPKPTVRQPPRKSELPVATDKESSGKTRTEYDITDDICVICMDPITDPKSLKCGHKFCRECIDESFKHKKVCPMCGAVCGIITGDQPPGTIQVHLAQHQHCMGYESVGQLQITYNFPSGHQGAEHPAPGKPYKGITRTGYLPDNKKGRLICKMLRIAFERRLVFTIGGSRTTGQKGVITWNDICHKTDPTPHTQFGYPDPSYLDRVIDELWAKGVTEADVPESSRI